MKKFLLFLTLLISAIGLTQAQAQAEKPSYTIEFKSAESDGSNAITAENLKKSYISAGIDYISSFKNVTRVYPGTKGLKLGTSSNVGSFTIEFATTAQVIPTKIVINAAKYSSDDGTIQITINPENKSAEPEPAKSPTSDLTWEFTGTSALSEAMTSLTVATNSKRAYIKSITVYYEEADASLTDPEISWTNLVEGAVEATLGGENTLPTLNNPYGVGITYSSSDESVATIAADGKIEIKAAGTTTIKAVSTADETYKSATATFTLNVNDPSLLKFTLNVSNDIKGLTKGDKINTITFNNITLSSAGATYYTSEIRVYAGNSIDVSVPSQYYIQKIEFTGSTFDNMSVTSTNGTLVTKGSSATWTYDSKKDKSNKVSFKNNASSQFRITSITITCGLAFADNDARLAFANDTDNATCGTPYTLQTLTNPKSVAVTWSSSNTEVADFNVDGTINIKKAGVTTITATATDAKYTVNNFASYTLTVIDTKRTDTFNASNLIFDEGSGYRNFTYTAESGAVYGGFADANGSTLMIQNQASGKSGIFVSQAPKGYKLHTITVSTATGSADLTLYGNTKPYASVSTDGKEIGTFAGGNKVNIYVNGYTPTIGAYGIIPTTFSICGADKASADNASSVTEITVIWELDTRADAGLAYASTEVTLAEGETLTQPKLNNLNSLPVTYSSDREDVATVDAEGTISLAGGLGTAVITASTDGNASYKPASTTFTITVREPIDQVANFSLVKNINDLHVGDIIVIACQSKPKVMSTTVNTNIRESVVVTFNSDKSALTTPETGLQLQVEKSDDGYWLFRTTNYLGTNGYLTSSGSSSSDCQVASTATDLSKATISLTETGAATILFNKGADKNDNNRNWLTYNHTNNKTNEGRFTCYGTSFSNGQDIFIYKFESNQTTIYDSDNISQTFVETAVGENNRVKLTYRVLTESTAEKLAVLVDGTKVAEFANNEGIVDITLDGVPYLPESEFTICPIYTIDAEGNTTLGHPETLNFIWAELPVLDFTSKKMELFFDSEAYKDASTCNLDAWVFLTVDMKDATTGESLGEADPRRNLTFSFEEFDNIQEGVEIYGWYTPYKEVQWCKYNYFTDVPVVEGLPNTASIKHDQTINLSFNAYFTFKVSAEFASLISTRLAAPARAGEAEVIQTVTQTTPLTFEGSWPESLDSVVSGVEGVTVDGGAAVEYYNLQGVRVDGDLAPGIYIRRQGQAVSKVRIN